MPKLPSLIYSTSEGAVYEILLTMTVVLWVSSKILEGERTSGGNDQHFQHEIIQCLKEDCAESLNFQWFAIVVAKLLRPLNEILARQALFNIDFKLVTDVLDTCTKETHH